MYRPFLLAHKRLKKSNELASFTITLTPEEEEALLQNRLIPIVPEQIPQSTSTSTSNPNSISCQNRTLAFTHSSYFHIYFSLTLTLTYTHAHIHINSLSSIVIYKFTSLINKFDVQRLLKRILNNRQNALRMSWKV
jgi:hypothetical protein